MCWLVVGYGWVDVVDDQIGLLIYVVDLVEVLLVLVDVGVCGCVLYVVNEGVVFWFG